MKPLQQLHLGEEAAGGLAAGVVGTIIGFPLDTIKTRLQLMATSSSSSTKTTMTTTTRASISTVATRIVQQEGVLALYRGMVPPLISLSILNTTNFTLYSFFRQQLVYGCNNDPTTTTTTTNQNNNGWDFRNALAGMSAAPIGSLVSTVENLVKTQVQLDNVQQQRYRGSLHCVQTLVRERNLSVLYTGHVINTVREGVFLGAYFYMYEGLREGLLQQQQWRREDYKMAVPVAGGCAGAMAWFVSFPLDCIRASVQGRNLSVQASNINNKSTLQVVRELIREKGLRRLYAGVTPSIARAFLVSASRFSAYEGTLWLIRGGRDQVDDGTGRRYSRRPTRRDR